MTSPTNAPAGRPELPFPDLASLSFEGEPLELTTDERDTDTELTDDEEGSLAALAMFLPSLPQVQPPIKPTTSGPTTATAADAQAEALASVILAKGTEEQIVQAAVEELTGDDSAESSPSNTGAAPPAMDPRVLANTTPSAHVQAMLATHTTQHADVVPDGSLKAHVGTPQWKDELGTQLTWMAMNGREAASLKLSPADLGPLDIRISMREGEASVVFGAANPDTRNALEQSLPRLRELFASQGLVLSDANVSRDAPRNAFKPSPHGEGSRSLSDASNEASVSSVTLTRAGLIDTYV